MKCNYCVNPATVKGRDFNGAEKAACVNHLKNLTIYSGIISHLPTPIYSAHSVVQQHAATPAPTANEPGPGPDELASRSMHPLFRPDLRPFTAGK